MAGATHQDAMVLLKLMEVSALRGMPVPLAWLSGTEFDPDYGSFRRKSPPGSEHFERAMAVVQHYEALGVLWKHGLVEEDLAFDFSPVEVVWERLQSFVRGVREELRSPVFGAHFEMMARAVIGIETVGVEARVTAAAPV